MISWLKALLIFISLSLLTYSYGFLDFNLTLTQHPIFLRFVSGLQQLVYFDRPLSSTIYIILILTMCTAFTGILGYWRTGKLMHFPWRFALVIIGILTISYPMLSYDVFNYMFHGKILWFYHQNPHLHAPLEYSGDLWLRFMRWVHTPSAYGPVFTAIESPSYLLGLGKFVPVLFLMKLSMSAFFIWSIYLIGKITQKLGFTPPKVVLAQLLIGLNPFLLLDVVVNGHNDAVMISLFLYAFLLNLQKHHLKSVIAFLLSVGVKFITVLALPMYFILNAKYKAIFASAVLLIPVLLSPWRFQPWYLVWALIPAALIDHKLARIWIVIQSLFGIIYYYPYIATGFWANSLPFVSLIIYLPILLTLAINYHLQGANSKK